MMMEITNNGTTLLGRTNIPIAVSSRQTSDVQSTLPAQIKDNHARAVGGTNILHALANSCVNTLSKRGAVMTAARRPMSNIAAPVKPLTTSE